MKRFFGRLSGYPKGKIMPADKTALRAECNAAYDQWKKQQ
jgi:hypothetical protein